MSPSTAVAAPSESSIRRVIPWAALIAGIITTIQNILTMLVLFVPAVDTSPARDTLVAIGMPSLMVAAVGLVLGIIGLRYALRRYALIGVVLCALSFVTFVLLDVLTPAV